MKTQKTFQCKIIQPNKNKGLKLNTTMRQYRKCINFYLYQIAQNKGLKDIYYEAKDIFNLPTALIQTAGDIAKEQYKSYKNNKDNPHFPHFLGFTPMRMDKRTINFRKEDNHFGYWANISTINRKIKVPITGRNLEKLIDDFKSVQVIFKNNSFYLNVIFEEEHKILKEKDFEHFAGVDLGLNNIVTIAVQNREGKLLETKFFSGKQLAEKRRRASELKAKLQSKKAWNKLKEIKGREKNYMKDLNHKISTEIIKIVKKYPNCCVVMEKLEGIRDKIKYSKEFNRKFYKWAFAEMQKFVTYKAHNNSIAVRRVYPAYTSQVCRNCMGKTERVSQSKAICKICKKEYNADLLGAINVTRRLFGYLSNNLGISGSCPKQGNVEHEGVIAPTFGESKGLVAQLNAS